MTPHESRAEVNLHLDAREVVDWGVLNGELLTLPLSAYAIYLFIRVLLILVYACPIEKERALHVHGAVPP